MDVLVLLLVRRNCYKPAGQNLCELVAGVRCFDGERAGGVATVLQEVVGRVVASTTWTLYVVLTAALRSPPALVARALCARRIMHHIYTPPSLTTHTPRIYCESCSCSNVPTVISIAPTNYDAYSY